MNQRGKNPAFKREKKKPCKRDDTDLTIRFELMMIIDASFSKFVLLSFEEA